MNFRMLVIGLVAVISTVLSGCATKSHVEDRMMAVSTRVTGEVFRMDKRFASLDSRVAKNEGDLSNVSRLAQEALDRATTASRLAAGKLLYEVTLTEGQIKFDTGKGALSEESQPLLAALVDKLKAENKSVYIEIQGHTDNRGSKEANKRLGLQRAESVRDFLYASGIPLHRMNVISYGSSQPEVEGTDADARAQNRRVVLMVLV